MFIFGSKLSFGGFIQRILSVLCHSRAPNRFLPLMIVDFIAEMCCVFAGLARARYVNGKLYLNYG